MKSRSTPKNARKQAEGYKHQSKAGWGDDVYRHIRENQGQYLGAVHTIIKERIKRGKPRTDESRHNFTAWVQSMDYIVYDMLGLAKLMDDHQHSYKTLSSPNHAWLRQVVIQAVQERGKPCEIVASEMGDIADVKGIEIPNLRNATTADDNVRNKAIGKLLGPIFAESFTFVQRKTGSEYLLKLPTKVISKSSLFEDGSSATCCLADPGSSVAVRDKNNAVEYLE